MRCPFCQARNSSKTRACQVCGGPLQGLNRLVSSPNSPQAASSQLAPIPPIGPIPEVPPAEPELIARHSREKGAPRIVAALFWKTENNFQPLFVLQNGELQGWNVIRDELHCFPPRRRLQKPSSTTAAVFSPGCGTVATGHESGQVRLQHLETDGAAAWKCRSLEVLEAHRGCVLSLAIAGTRLYSAGTDGAVVLTQLPGVPSKTAENRPISVVLDGLSALSCLAVSPDGRYLALGADDGQVQMWRLDETGSQARLDWTSRKDATPVQSMVKSLMFSPNGHMLLSRNAQGDVCLWAAQSGHRLPWMAQPNSPVLPALAPDNRLLAHANASGGIALFDAWTGTLRHTLSPVRGEVQALGFSPATDIHPRETLLIAAGSQQMVAWKLSL